MYDIEVAKLCLELCKYSHKLEYVSHIKEKTINNYNLTDIQFFDIFDVEGFCCIINKTLFITFQGSISLWDWVQNFFTWKKKIPYNNQKTNIRIHYGFLSMYEEIRKELHFIYKSFYSNFIKDIVVTGFSLGGALATLCAVDFEYNFDKKVYCYTFASPRVGNKYFTDSYNKRIPETYRHVNNNDIVTRVPFKLLNFKHVGNLIKIGEKYSKFKIFGDFGYSHRYESYTDNLN